MSWGPYYASLPIDGSSRHYVDQTNWDLLIGNLAAWPGAVNANGQNLSALGIVSYNNGGSFSGSGGNNLLYSGQAIEIDSTAGSGNWAQLVLFGNYTVNNRAWRIASDAAGHFGIEYMADNFTANSRVIDINRSGQVGIGTATQAYLLSLGNAATAQKLAVYDGGGDFYGFGIGSGLLRYDAGSGGAHAFFTSSGVERMRLRPDGGFYWTLLTTTIDTALANGQINLVLTTNTNLEIRVKGSDGTVRKVDLTLA